MLITRYPSFLLTDLGKMLLRGTAKVGRVVFKCLNADPCFFWYSESTSYLISSVSKSNSRSDATSRNELGEDSTLKPNSLSVVLSRIPPDLLPFLIPSSRRPCIGGRYL
jgi:hypothetical protein